MSQRTTTDILSELLSKVEDMQLPEGDYLRTANALKEVFTKCEKNKDETITPVDKTVSVRGKIVLKGIEEIMIRVKSIRHKGQLIKREHSSIWDVERLCVAQFSFIDGGEHIITPWKEYEFEKLSQYAAQMKDNYTGSCKTFYGLNKTGIYTCYLDWKQVKKLHLEEENYDDDDGLDVYDFVKEKVYYLLNHLENVNMDILHSLE